MSIVLYNIPEMCRTGEVCCLRQLPPQPRVSCCVQVNQQDEPGFVDYSSFGSGPGSCDLDASEAQCRTNYDQLVDNLLKYERALEVTSRLNEDGINIQVSP